MAGENMSLRSARNREHDRRRASDTGSPIDRIVPDLARGREGSPDLSRGRGGSQGAPRDWHTLDDRVDGNCGPWMLLHDRVLPRMHERA